MNRGGTVRDVRILYTVVQLSSKSKIVSLKYNLKIKRCKYSEIILAWSHLIYYLKNPKVLIKKNIDM